MYTSKLEFGRTMNEMIIDDIVSDILYNMNIEMFKTEVSNEILEKTVYFKKVLSNNIYDYETFNLYIKKINIKWSDEILTDKFINLLLEFEKAFSNYKKSKEKEIIDFAMEHDAKNLFKSMEKLSFKPKKTIKKLQSKKLTSLFSSSCSVE